MHRSVRPCLCEWKTFNRIKCICRDADEDRASEAERGGREKDDEHMWRFQMQDFMMFKGVPCCDVFLGALLLPVA